TPIFARHGTEPATESDRQHRRLSRRCACRRRGQLHGGDQLQSRLDTDADALWRSRVAARGRLPCRDPGWRGPGLAGQSPHAAGCRLSPTRERPVADLVGGPGRLDVLRALTRRGLPRHFTWIVIRFDTSGGSNGTWWASPNSSCRVCVPGLSAMVVSVWPPPKWMCCASF